MKFSEENVRLFYENNVLKEWHRLDGQYSNIEFSIVKKELFRSLKKECDILDLGCGPGKYAIELTKQGHNIFLVDISQRNLEYAIEEIRKNGLEKRIIGVKCCSAFEFRCEHKFDAVLVFGPLYHMLDNDQVRTTLKNIKYMTRKDGYVYTIFIQMISIFKDFLKRGWVDEITKLISDDYLNTGLYYPSCWRQIEQYMPNFRAYKVQTAKRIITEGGFEIEKTMTCESFAAFMRPYFEKNPFSQQKYEKLLDLLYEIASEDFLLQSTDHFLIVSRKR